MAEERMPPVAVQTSINYSSITLADVVDDPDDPDGTWGAWDGQGDTQVRVRFGNPVHPLVNGVDLQEFRCLIRKVPTADGNATSWRLQLWQSGTFIADLATGTTVSTEGEVVSGRWNASMLTTGSIQFGLVQSNGGVDPGARGIELGAVVWVAATTGPPVEGSGNLGVSPSAVFGTGSSGSSGSGNIVPSGSSLASTGATGSAGEGALAASASAVIGEGATGSTGTGALEASDTTVTGDGATAFSGAGALVSGDSTLTGQGASGSTGAGQLVSTDSTVIGSGTEITTGAGALAAGPATVEGEGVTLSTGAGALTSSAASVSGTGVSGSVGVGQLVSGPSTLAGQGVDEGFPNIIDLPASRRLPIELVASRTPHDYLASGSGGV